MTGTVVEAVIVGREIGSATSARLTTLHAAISASNVRPPKVKMTAVMEMMDTVTAVAVAVAEDMAMVVVVGVVVTIAVGVTVVVVVAAVAVAVIEVVTMTDMVMTTDTGG